MKHISISLITLFIILIFSACNAESNPIPIENNPPPENSTISFAQSTQTLGNTRSFGLAIADVDLDGDTDIFIADYVGPSRLWLNDGNGHFTQVNQNFGTSATSTHDADIADLNGDSYPDIFVANHDEPSKIYFNNGDGSFEESEQTIGSVGEYPQTIQLVDINSDGNIDAYLYNIDAANRLWLNDGSGFFTMRNIDYGGSTSNKQVLADLNDDSFPDLYISYRNQQPAQIWLNDGAGNFFDSGQTLGQGAEVVDFGDIDGDGDTDIVVGNINVTIWFNQNNTGTFSAGPSFDERAIRFKLFDADLDNDLDLATIHTEGGNRLWLNNGSGNFTFHGTIFGTSRMLCIDCAKLDADENYDIIFGGIEGTGGNKLYFNESTLP